MLIRVEQVRLPLGAAEEELPHLACARIGVKSSLLRAWRIVRRSLDARHPHDIHFVYHVDLDLPDEAGGRLRLRGARVLEAEKDAREEVQPGSRPLPGPVVVVGAGPAGLFLALALAEAGYRPLVIERGQPVEKRRRDLQDFLRTRRPDPDSNLLFGEGGAGTFSDGKLTTGIGDRRVRRVLETFVACGAPRDILVDAQPHLGTDRLREVIPRLRRRIEAAGGEVRFGCRLDRVLLEKGAVRGLVAGGSRLRAGLLCLAIGHSARDTYRMLAESGVPMTAKPFQMGLRVEHPQADLDRSRYGPSAGHPDLPPASYRLTARGRNVPRPVTTFCMCPGGVVVPAVSEPGHLATNGMSPSARDGACANSALVLTVGPEEFGSGPLDGVAFQRRWEKRAFELAGSDSSAPAQRMADFLAGRPSTGPIPSTYPLGTRPVMLAEILPPVAALSIARAVPLLDQRLGVFDRPETVLLGPETRASSPVRILRSPETRASVRIAGLYPVGEGAGYAGGIVSAAVDGLCTAETIIRTFAPPA